MTFWQIIWIIIAITTSILVVRFSFTFDINKYLESKKESARAKAKNYCPHCQIYFDGNKKWLKSTFYSPVWTTDWVCQRCGLIRWFIDEWLEQKRIEYYLLHFDEYKKDEKKFMKYVKKAGAL